MSQNPFAAVGIVYREERHVVMFAAGTSDLGPAITLALSPDTARYYAQSLLTAAEAADEMNQRAAPPPPQQGETR